MTAGTHGMAFEKLILWRAHRSLLRCQLGLRIWQTRWTNPLRRHTFRSHLPVSMDGTCNGYQHLSAMGRDPIGGSATNLIPADQPEDMYQEVADHVSIRIMFDAEYGSAREARGRQAEASSDDREAARELLG